MTQTPMPLKDGPPSAEAQSSKGVLPTKQRINWEVAAVRLVLT